MYGNGRTILNHCNSSGYWAYEVTVIFSIHLNNHNIEHTKQEKI